MSDQMTALIREYHDWTRTQAEKVEGFAHGTEALSADELLCDLEYALASTDDATEIGEITIQCRWLRDFIRRWNDVAEEECAARNNAKGEDDHV
jgi:hypothetical protein